MCVIHAKTEPKSISEYINRLFQKCGIKMNKNQFALAGSVWIRDRSFYVIMPAIHAIQIIVKLKWHIHLHNAKDYYHYQPYFKDR